MRGLRAVIGLATVAVAVLPALGAVPASGADRPTGHSSGLRARPSASALGPVGVSRRHMTEPTTTARSGRAVRAPSRPADSPATSELGTFVPLSPARFVDTRPGPRTFDGQGSGSGAIGPKTSAPFQIGGRGAVPPDASAVVITLTEASDTTGTYLTAYPNGRSVPTASNVNALKGQTTAATATVALTAGALRVYNAAGSTQVVIDVVGYYQSADGQYDADVYEPIEPTRILDTRHIASGQLGPGDSYVVCPFATDSGVLATALNVTATAPDAAGYLVVWPDGEDPPATSTVNYARGQTVANLTFTATGTDSDGGTCDGRQSFDVGNPTDSTVQVVIDVDGVYVDEAENDGGYYRALSSPTRLVDTRKRQGFGPLGAGATGTVDTSGIGTGETTGIVGSIVGLSDPSATDLAAYPGGGSAPTVSNVNVEARGLRANALIVGVGTDSTRPVTVRNDQGVSDVLLDVSGYFLDPGAGAGTTVTATPDRTELSQGDPLTVAVTVTPTDTGAVPTGTAYLYEPSTDTLYGQADLDATGAASIVSTTLPAGDHQLEVLYGGDTTYAPSLSPTFDETVD